MMYVDSGLKVVVVRNEASIQGNEIFSKQIKKPGLKSLFEDRS